METLGIRERYARGIYRTRYRGTWLYSVYRREYNYHQMISDTKAADMDFDTILTYMHERHRWANALRARMGKKMHYFYG